MIINITISSHPGEFTSHLKRNLITLLHNAHFFYQHNGASTEEWTTADFYQDQRGVPNPELLHDLAFQFPSTNGDENTNQNKQTQTNI